MKVLMCLVTHVSPVVSLGVPAPLATQGPPALATPVVPAQLPGGTLLISLTLLILLTLLTLPPLTSSRLCTSGERCCPDL